MVTNYKQVKDEVLLQYDEFLAFLKQVRNIGASLNENSLAALENQAANIRADKFFLMVVGEASSGKSTFINAYLGKGILPMDVKQCTSAIVEIRYGKRFILKATYADGRTVTLEDEEQIKRFLTENAALDDEYQDIPVPTINNEILIRKKGMRPRKQEIDDLITGIMKDKWLTEEEYSEYRNKVELYITTRTPFWMNVVTMIEIEYPFEDADMKGIEIVDTPGVNAIGGLSEITESYIQKADAVMFLKPMVGGVLDTKSFRNFLSKNAERRRKETMFLLLTRSANETPDNIARIHDDAYRQFQGIDKHQIIHIDSKVELFYKQIEAMSEEELNAYMEPLIEEERLDSFLETPWYKSKGRRETYLQKLKDLSNFEAINEALNRFAHKAHYMSISSFLKRMADVLDAIDGQMSETISNYMKKAVDPLKLEAELADKMQELDGLKLKINSTAKTIGGQYTSRGGIIEAKAEEVVAEYQKRITALDESSEGSMEQLKNITSQTVARYVTYQEELEKEIAAKCDAELVSMSGKGTIPFKSLKPDLTPETIENIKKMQADNAYETKYTSGGCFKKASSFSTFSQSKFFGLVRDDINIRIEEVKSAFITLLSDFVGEILKAYRAELISNADRLQDEYDKVLNDKAEAEELQNKIADMNAVWIQVGPLRDKTLGIKRGVDKHV